MLRIPGVFIVAAKRTPFGAFGGALRELTANELGAIASGAVLKQLPDIKVDSVIFGNVCQTSVDAAYLARHVGLRAGLPIELPALTVNRLCGSGFQAVVSAAHEIAIGDASVVLAGGAENMSQAPFVARGIRWGISFGRHEQLEDVLLSALVDRYPREMPMGITAENLSEKFGISRADCEQYSQKSQQRWAEAHKAGIFESEIAAVKVKSRKGGEVLFEVDEHPRPDTTVEKLSKLKPSFKPGGVVTPGTASGIADGAAALVVVSEDALRKFNLQPLARVVNWSVAGVDPSMMGYGPVPAIRNLLKRARLSLEEIDLIEVNEAFAAQYLAVQKELGLDPKKTNLCGGAIALGHPLAASGARILAHLTHELQRQRLKYAIGSACIGGGQGIAVLLERC